MRGAWGTMARTRFSRLRCARHQFGQGDWRKEIRTYAPTAVDAGEDGEGGDEDGDVCDGDDE